MRMVEIFLRVEKPAAAAADGGKYSFKPAEGGGAVTLVGRVGGDSWAGSQGGAANVTKDLGRPASSGKLSCLSRLVTREDSGILCCGLWKVVRWNEAAGSRPVLRKAAKAMEKLRIGLRFTKQKGGRKDGCAVGQPGR